MQPEIWYALATQFKRGGTNGELWRIMANCAVVLGPIRHKNLRHNSP